MTKFDKRDPLFIDKFAKMWDEAVKCLKDSSYDLSIIKIAEKGVE